MPLEQLDYALCVKEFLVEIARLCWLPSTDEQYVRQWLSQEQNGSWLIVIDAGTIPDPHVCEIVALFPECSHGSFLMLIRFNPFTISEQLRSMLGQLPQHVYLQVSMRDMTESESFALLRHRVPLDYSDEEVRSLGETVHRKLPGALIDAADAFVAARSATVGQVDGNDRLVTDEETSPSRDATQEASSNVESEVDPAVDLKNATTTRIPALQNWLEDQETNVPTLLLGQVPERKSNRLDHVDEVVKIIRSGRTARTALNRPASNRPRRAREFESLPTAREPASAASEFLRGFHSMPTPSYRQEDEPPAFDAEGQEIGGEYVLGKQIAFGGYCSIKEASRMQAGKQQKLAVKIVPKATLGVSEEVSVKILDAFKVGLNIWKKLAHNNIIPLESLIETNEALFCFMPLSTGGTLFDLVSTARRSDRRDFVPTTRPSDRRGIGDFLARSYSHQLASALQYLHFEVGIEHCDVNLQNCLLTATTTGEPGTLRLCDFDVATMSPFLQVDEPHGAHFGSAVLGTLEYLAPELVREQAPATPVWSLGLDVWAYGVCVYTMVTGDMPFRHPVKSRVAEAIVSGKWDRDRLANDGGADVTELVNGCLEMDAKARWNMENVLTCSWFRMLYSEALKL